MPTIIDAARRYAAAGLSVIPIRLGGGKSPAWDKWQQFEARIADEQEIVAMFSRNVGIAIIGGAVSGGLEILDFDKPGLFEQWMGDLAEIDPAIHEIAESLPRVYTPALGMHLYFRCATVAGNLKLAKARTPFVDCTGKEKITLIETRGEGGYVLAPPSPAECHKAGRAYEWIGGAKLTDIPIVSTGTLEIFHQAARVYNEVAVEAKQNSTNRSLTPGAAGRPGDDYNATGPSWGEILTPRGWTLVHSRGDTDYWRRPGKTDGISATTGHCGDKFYVFSSNASPFDSERTYDKFATFCLLEHGGDFARAASELSGEGYGDKRLAVNAASAEPPPDDVPHTVPTAALKKKAKSLSFAEVVDLWESSDGEQFIATPVPALNEALAGGWPVGQVSVIVAYTRCGKTEFVRQSAILAASMGHSVVHCDVELGYKRLFERTLSQATGISPQRLRHRNQLDQDEQKMLTKRLAELRNESKMRFLCPGGSLPLADLGELLAQDVMAMDREKPALLVLDSLQRLAHGSDEDSPRLRVEEFMHWVTNLAQSLNVAIIVPSEQKRSQEGGAPTVEGALSSGAESRSVEYQSDVMLALVPEEKKETLEACGSDDESERKVQIFICKNRAGSGEGYVRDSIVFEGPCWGMRVEQRKRQETIDLVLECLPAKFADGISALKIAKTIHRQVSAVRQVCLELVEQGKAIRSGAGKSTKYCLNASSHLSIPRGGSLTKSIKIPTPGSIETAKMELPSNHSLFVDPEDRIDS